MAGKTKKPETNWFCEAMTEANRVIPKPKQNAKASKQAKKK